MNVDLITIILSLLSALASSFLASYLTYYYTEKSWRRRQHLEDIKQKCPKEILSGVERFESRFSIEEHAISHWVRSDFGRPSSN